MKKRRWKDSIPNILFSFFFALVFLLDTKLEYSESTIGPFTKVDFNSFLVKDIFLYLLLFGITYVILLFIEKIYDKFSSKESIKKNIPIFKISLVILLVAWLPYILTYFPGGIYYDTFASIKQVENGFINVTNHNPILYTFLLKGFTTLGEITNVGLKGGIGYFLIFQYLFCTFVLSYAVKVLYQKKIPKWCVYFALAFFAFFPLVPFYVTSIWKDTPFSFVLFLFILFLFDKWGSTFFHKKSDYVIYFSLAFFVCFLRNNGILIIIGTTIVIYLITKNKKFEISGAIFLFIILIIQGPVYSCFKLNGSTFVEASAIPFQQIAYTIRSNENISREKLAFIENVIPLEILNNVYIPTNFDTIKFNKNFNTYTFSENKKEFLKVWFQLFPKNISNYTKAYLLQTLGFWDYFRASDTAYIQNTIWENEYGLTGTNIIEDITGISLKNILEPKIIFSSAFFVWITLLSFAITFTKRKYKFIIFYLPSLLLWGSIMIGTPIAFSLRYVYVLVLFIPFNVIIPMLPYENI